MKTNIAPGLAGTYTSTTFLNSVHSEQAEC